MSTNKQALRQLAVDAKELAIIKRYTKGIEAQKKFIAAATPATVLALLDELEAAEKRIAELEAREVSVPNVSSERFWVEFNGRLVFREETYRSAVFKALDAAGITVKGDSE